MNRFNPRPRMEGDPHAPIVGSVSTVSIHAPAWRATIKGYHSKYSVFVSIHAPAWRATIVLLCFSCQSSVSIHAPAWRATLANKIAISTGYGFNPRPRMEGDSILILFFLILIRFNPRPRMEGDGCSEDKADIINRFNPRPRMEGDYNFRGNPP